MDATAATRRLMRLACCISGVLVLSFLLPSALAEERFYEFVVQETVVKRLCETSKIITVNGQFPGPTIEVHDGDTLAIKAVNRAQYNVTLHWHGLRQLRNGWADGPEFVTQCPIRPGSSYTYRFTVQEQEGTLWWHAHSSWLRATVHGALVILPKRGRPYPFPKPAKEFPVVLAEWWRRDPIAVLRQSMVTGAGPNVSDAILINGQPGDFLQCSSQVKLIIGDHHAETSIIPVVAGETNLLRIINAAMNSELFVSLAGHKMTVVAADAMYTKPFETTVVLLGPGQTTDVLVTAHAAPGRYYLGARVYASARGVPVDNTTATAIFQYKKAAAGAGAGAPMFPAMLPANNDTKTATAFSNSIRSPRPVKVPGPVTQEELEKILGLLNQTLSKIRLEIPKQQQGSAKDTSDRLNPFASVDDLASAAMADGPGSPSSPVADGPGAPAAIDPPQPPPALLPTGPVASVPVAGPVAAAPTTTVLPSVLQTIDIRCHVPITLDLLASNYAQWRRHFDTVIGMFGLRDHVDAAVVPRFDDPDYSSIRNPKPWSQQLAAHSS
ncbi:Laccase-3 [Triticum urartu]|uniref:laccase n=1 Tax=Triticum urartu TaxID=4572 RepID=M8AE68_TRIUA|nr:Laccase-3 [Triticum urartu]